jgi:tetratricopeptide (TPR) repeat protein
MPFSMGNPNSSGLSRPAGDGMAVPKLLPSSTPDAWPKDLRKFDDRRFDAALVQGLKTVDMDPSFVGVRAELARVYVFLHRCPQALAALENTNAPPAAQLLGVPGYAYAKCGSRARALAEIDRLDAQAKSGAYVSHYGLAVIHSGLGNSDQAFAELEKAYLERAWSMFLLRLEPAFDDLRSDPRFAELVKKVSSGALL